VRAARRFERNRWATVRERIVLKKMPECNLAEASKDE